MKFCRTLLKNSLPILKLLFPRIVLTFLFIATVSSISYSKEIVNLVLEGTVGKAAIVMEINIDGLEVSGEYYYKRFRKSIPLYGKYINGESIELIYEHWDKKETFQIKDIGKGTTMLYSGTWRNGNSTTTLPVTLRLAEPTKVSVKNEYVKRALLSEYNFIRLANVSLKQDSIQILSPEISIYWLHDTLSGFSAFRIIKNQLLKGTDSINYFLETLQFNELLSFLDCNGSEYNSEIHSVYARNHVLSFALSSSYECGGAHPDFGTAGYTFNLETGKRMELTDFLFFGKTKNDYTPDKDYKLGGDIMGPNIVKLLTEIYPHEMQKHSEEEDGCDYSSEDVWNYTPWYLTSKGLYLYPYFYRAARGCDGADFSVIPYDVLIKYKNPKVSIPMKY